jgi:superfamily II DNA/RNA helicase
MSDKAEHPPIPQAFADLGVRPSILRALAELKYTTPSDIQRMLIPRALAGVDILGQARTGTGKTAAFAIPLLQRMTPGIATQGIILVPTRELAVQVHSEIERIGQHTPIRAVPVYGGQKIMAQMKFLRHGPEILVGTPGRAIDLLDRRIVNLDNVRYVVLDEVDRMLDIGFRDDIRNILGRIRSIRKQLERSDAEESRPTGHDGAQARSVGVPPQSVDATPPAAAPIIIEPLMDSVQTIFVSATISPDIERLGRQYMHEPVEKLIAPGADERPTVENVKQYYVSVQPWDKYKCMLALLRHENPDLAIVFCRT